MKKGKKDKKGKKSVSTYNYILYINIWIMKCLIDKSFLSSWLYVNLICECFSSVLWRTGNRKQTRKGRSGYERHTRKTGDNRSEFNWKLMEKMEQVIQTLSNSLDVQTLTNKKACCPSGKRLCSHVCWGSAQVSSLLIETIEQMTRVEAYSGSFHALTELMLVVMQSLSVAGRYKPNTIQSLVRFRYNPCTGVPSVNWVMVCVSFFQCLFFPTCDISV